MDREAEAAVVAAAATAAGAGYWRHSRLRKREPTRLFQSRRPRLPGRTAGSVPAVPGSDGSGNDPCRPYRGDRLPRWRANTGHRGNRAIAVAPGSVALRAAPQPEVSRSVPLPRSGLDATNAYS